jgi:hypothetical protein
MFQKDLLFGVNLTFFAPWLPWQQLPLDKPKKIGIGWTNFVAVAMGTKKGGFKKKLDSFHQTS